MPLAQVFGFEHLFKQIKEDTPMHPTYSSGAFWFRTSGGERKTQGGESTSVLLVLGAQRRLFSSQGLGSSVETFCFFALVLLGFGTRTICRFSSLKTGKRSGPFASIIYFMYPKLLNAS